MRDEVEGRPLLSLFVGIVTGLVAVASPIAILFLAFWIYWVRPLQLRLLFAIAFVVGLGLAPTPPKNLDGDELIHARATVASVPKPTPDGQIFQASLEGRIIQVTVSGSSLLTLGDQILLDGVERPFSGPMERYAASMGLEGSLRTEKVEVIRSGSVIAQLSSRWRSSFLEFTASSMGPSSAAMVDAVSFNSRSLLDKATQDELRKSGLIHIVTVSGLQVFVLAALVAGALRFFPVPRWVQILLLAGLLGIYALSSGLSPAIVRASLMCIVGLGAFLFKREPDNLSALALAGVGYLIWDAYAVYNLGFQLSYLTIACVAVFYRPDLDVKETTKKKFIRLTKNYLMLSSVVLMATTPLIAYAFGSVPIISIVANVAVLWCLPILIASSFISYGVWLFFPLLGKQMANVLCEPMTSWIETVLRISGGSSSTVSVPTFSVYLPIAFYVCWLLTMRRRIVQP